MKSKSLFIATLLAVSAASCAMSPLIEQPEGSAKASSRPAMANSESQEGLSISSRKLFGTRPAIPSSSWEDLGAHDLDHLMRTVWPTSSLEGFHTIMALEDCIGSESAKRLRDAGFMPVASCPNGDVVVVEISGALSMYAMSHSAFLGLDDDPPRFAPTELRELGHNLALYLEKFFRMEQQAEENGEYDTEAKESLPSDYWELAPS